MPYFVVLVLNREYSGLGRLAGLGLKELRRCEETKVVGT